MANDRFRDFDLLMLRGIGKTLIFEDSFMLADTFGVQAETTYTFIDKIRLQSEPCKINFSLVLVCTKGRLRIRIDLEEKEIAANDAIVALPGCIGQFAEISEDCGLFIFGSDTASDMMHGGDPTHDTLILKRLGSNPVFHLRGDEVQELLTYYRLMRAKIEAPDTEFTKSYLQHIMSALILSGYSWITDGKSEEGGQVSPRQRQLLFDFMSLVKANYSTQRELGFYADKLCLTPKYLSQVIHDASGRFAGEWIRDYVIMNAKVLLRSRRYTVQQVGDMLGFDNASFFGKYFKAATGMPPRKYMLKP